MNKTAKRSVVVSAVLAIALCVSLIAGATFALFTSESEVNVSVSSGKVNVVANIDEQSIELYSPKTITDEGIISDGTNIATETRFANGGTVAIDGGEITVSGMTPGDKVSFTIKVKNNSNVSVKYRTIVSATDSGLFQGLAVTIDGQNYAGNTRVSAWTELAVGSDLADVQVVIELPSIADNRYQDKSMTLTYAVNAVQGNIETENLATDIYYAYSALDLVAFDKDNFAKLAIMDNIDMTGVAWEAIRLVANDDLEVIGNRKTITGLTDALVSAEAGVDLVIKNLTIEGANILGNTEEETMGMGTGAFVSFMDTSCSLLLENCHVKNSTIKAENYTDDGALVEPRAGGLVGYASAAEVGKELKISGCSVENCEIGSENGAGAIVCFVGGDITIENCQVSGTTATGTKLYCTENRGGGAAKAGKLIGTVNGGTTHLNNCTVSGTITVENVNAKAPVVDGLVGRIVGATAGVEVNGTAYVSASALKAILVANSDVEGEVGLHKNYTVLDAWTPIDNAADLGPRNLVITGNGKTISGLTAPLVGFMTYSVEITGLTIANSTIGDIDKGGEYVYTSAFVAYADSNDLVKLDSCSIQTSTIGAGTAKYSGGFVGYFSGSELEITNCTIDGNTVIKNNNHGSLGGIAGFIQTAADKTQKISGCTVIDAAKLVDGKYTGRIVGTVNSASDTDTAHNYVLEIVLPAGVGFDTTMYGRIVGVAKILCDGTHYAA